MRVVIKEMCGGSNYFLVPSEFVKVHNLRNYMYELKVSKNGDILTYKRVKKRKDL